jgi:hypothetical protein
LMLTYAQWGILRGRSQSLFSVHHSKLSCVSKLFRKAEDGCVDICFYDWRYFGSYTSSLTFQLFNEGVRLPNQPCLQPYSPVGLLYTAS